ncbi:hypothetical protein AnigIFM49718_003019 [Aspergillus niger]|nr:hypothetical protein AnigIFM49718_003019 [Aspergillus niger]
MPIRFDWPRMVGQCNTTHNSLEHFLSIQLLKIGHVVEEDYHSLLSELLDVVQRRDWFRLEELIIEAEDVENKPIRSFDTSMHGRWCYNYPYIAAGLVVGAWWL